jgi:hypothetical protein
VKVDDHSAVLPSKRRYSGAISSKPRPAARSNEPRRSAVEIKEERRDKSQSSCVASQNVVFGRRKTGSASDAHQHFVSPNVRIQIQEGGIMAIVDEVIE